MQWPGRTRAEPPFGAVGRLFNVIAKIVQNGLICQVVRVEREQVVSTAKASVVASLVGRRGNTPGCVQRFAWHR
jgi:hypothetical protein